MNLNSCGIRKVYKVSLALLSVFFKLPFAVLATNFSLLLLFFRPSACSVALFSSVGLLFTCLAAHFSAVNSSFIILFVQGTPSAGLNIY